MLWFEHVAEHLDNVPELCDKVFNSGRIGQVSLVIAESYNVGGKEGA